MRNGRRVRYIWRIMQGDDEVGRVRWEDGKVSYAWPPGWEVVGKEIETGMMGWLNIVSWSSKPRPELAATPEYIHDVVCIHFDGPFRVETNFRGKPYPTHDDEGNPIYY